MKRLILAALLLLAFACQRRDIVTEDKVQVTFDFAGAALPASRSVVGAAEDEINSLLMLFYENGSGIGLEMWSLKKMGLHPNCAELLFTGDTQRLLEQTLEELEAEQS